MAGLSLRDENTYVALLTQALLGVISANFRMVYILFSQPEWKIVVALEREDAEDLEGIEDFTSEFSALLPHGGLRFTVETRLGCAALDWPRQARIVFLRREARSRAGPVEE